MTAIRDILGQSFLFEAFVDEDMDLLSGSTSLKKVKKGEHIFFEGSEATAFYVIVTGRVKIYKLSSDGKEYTLHIHGPGDPVAEAAIFDSATYPASCIALEDATVVRITRDGFLRMMKKYPELSVKIMSGYSKRLRLFVAKIEELTGRDVKSRLARYLLENSVFEKGNTVCHLKHSKKELSSLLGTIPETLSRTLAFFKQQKIISDRGTTIVISHPDKLKLIAQ